MGNFFPIFVFVHICSVLVIILPPIQKGTPTMAQAFSEEEYKKGIAALKNNKAAGSEDVLVEQLKHLGQKVNKWLHTMLNVCFTGNKFPKIWRQSKIIAILKPGKGFRTGKSCTSQLLNLTQTH